MGWRMTGDAAEFLAAAGEGLRRDRVRNTVVLTVAEQLRVNPARYSGAAGPDAGPAGRPLFGWQTDGAGGAFLHTPPFPLLLTGAGAAAAASLAAALEGRPVAGVNSTQDAARGFAAAWLPAVGGQVTVHRRERLYRLAALSWTDPVPGGAPRAAAAADIPLVAGWFAAFAREVGELGGSDDYTAAARDRLSHGGALLWEAGGVPVSLACLTRSVAGMTRVGPVYTPPALRGRGYASAVTAAVSQRALDAGAGDVLLFTDLANPVSNSIYQRLGYRGVEDHVMLAFSPPE